MSYKRKLLTIGSTVMLTAGIVTLSQLDAQKVEASQEVIATNSVEQQEKLIDKTVKEIANDLDSSSLSNEGEVKAASDEEVEKSTISDNSNKKEKETSDDTTQDGQNNSSETKPNPDSDAAVTPSLKTGWDGESYYINGKKVTSKWLEVTAKDDKDDETTKYWYYFDENGRYVTDTWKGSYYLKANGQMAHDEWVENLETGRHYFNSDGTYVQNKWVDHYYIKQWGYVASNEWIYDKDKENWYFIKEDGRCVTDTWKGSYYLKADGQMAKDGWAKSPETGWHFFNPDGTYVQNKWIGAYYIKQWGYMAQNEWIYDKDYENWFFINEDGSYAHDTWKGSYYLTKWGEMAKDGWAESPETGWHYFNPDGTYVQNKWIGSYYIKQWGYMAQNEWIWDNHEWYYMTPETGIMATGWTDVNGDIYYMNANGTIHHGLVYDQEKDGWYYFDNKGLLKIGTIKLKDIDLTVKTDKEGKISSDVDYLKKINHTVGWFEDREGKVTYSMAKRNGPDSYDCSSSLYNALWNGKFKTKISYAGTTENLYKEKGYLFKEIDARDIRRGDVFISGNEGYSLGAGGHTGIAYNDNSILHCTYKLDGIYLTPIKGYTVEHKYPVRWFRIVNQK